MNWVTVSKQEHLGEMQYKIGCRKDKERNNGQRRIWSGEPIKRCVREKNVSVLCV